MNTCKIIKVMGSNTNSWAEAAKTSVEEAGKNVSDFPITKIEKLDMRILVGAAMALLGVSDAALASTNLDGELTWNFASELPPVVGSPFYGTTPNLFDPFGRLYFDNNHTLTFPTGGDWGPQGAAYLAKSPYTFESNTISGQWDKQTHKLQFDWTANSRAAGETAAMQADMFVYYDFPNAQVFPGISYAYDFSGAVGVGGGVRFGVQVELLYFNYVNQTRQLVYSNYGNYGGQYGEIFDKSFPFFSITTPGVFNRSGTFSLGSFAVADGVYCGTGCVDPFGGISRWQLSFDFAGGGYDVAGVSTVPEPSEALLLSAGLGIVSLLTKRVRRREDDSGKPLT